MQIYLQSFRAKLRVRNGLFEVRYANEKMKVHREQFSAKKVEAIWLQDKTSVSIAAIQLAIQEGIDVLFLNKFGHPTGRLLSTKPTGTTRIQKAQLGLSQQPFISLQFAHQWIVKKMINQRVFLRELKAYRSPEKQHFLENQAQKIQRLIEKAKQLTNFESLKWSGSIRGLEGTSGRIYFESLSTLLPKEWRFTGRSRRPAKDEFNAFLNYSYGILYSVIERALLRVGLNPAIGFLHRDGYHQMSLVFDFIEPYRILSERAIFKLFSQKKVSKKDVSTVEKGLSLDKEGRKEVIAAFNQSIGKKRLFNAKRYRIRDIIEKEARQFAKSVEERFFAESTLLTIEG